MNKFKKYITFLLVVFLSISLLNSCGVKNKLYRIEDINKK